MKNKTMMEYKFRHPYTREVYYSLGRTAKEARDQLAKDYKEVNWTLSRVMLNEGKSVKYEQNHFCLE